MTTLDVMGMIGSEEIQRRVLTILFDKLNDKITLIENYMDPLDAEFFGHMNRPMQPTTLELVEEENFYEGDRPSLIDAPITNYPNCAVMSMRAGAAPGSDALDQQNAYLVTFAVEIMAKSSESESEADRRIKRMAEAVNLALQEDQTLGGLIHGFNTAPTVIWGGVFTRKETTSYGAEWFWKGARLEYTVRKNAIVPSYNLGEIVGNGLFSLTGSGSGTDQEP